MNTHETAAAAAGAADRAAKERPISFTAPMVRAILACTKTQTRRVVKITHRTPGLAACLEPADPAWVRPATAAQLCPYGQPGNRLWVREAFRTDSSHNHLPPSEVPPAWALQYEADGDVRPGLGLADGKLRPPMFMPRTASRLLLEVVSVRVERLQAISEADAEAEGVDFLRHAPEADETLTAAQLYRCLWDAINGDGAWDANPWVWVVEFKRLAAAAGSPSC